jgi:hypothetical protein
MTAFQNARLPRSQALRATADGLTNPRLALVKARAAESDVISALLQGQVDQAYVTDDCYELVGEISATDVLRYFADGDAGCPASLGMPLANC